MESKFDMSAAQDALKFYQDRMDDWMQGLPASLRQEMGKEFMMAWQDISTQMMNNPQEWMTRMMGYQQKQTELWFSMFGGGKKDDVPDVAKPKLGDRRFKAKEWKDNPLFDYIKQSYLLAADALTECADATQLDEQNKNKLKFYTSQMIDAMSPSNFAATNPEVLQHAMETKGKSLVDGMSNLLGDLDKGRISMTDEEAFTLGQNIATTEGSVVFENEMFQLIQYKPITEKVNERPLVIIPPFINKFYILDLQPENSYVRYCLEQGNNTFIVSWANHGEENSDIGWDDYIEKGVLKAYEVVKEITGAPQLNTVAWCVGGTLLSTSLAVLQARGDKTVASATFFTTLLDFTEPGELGVFIDEEQIAERDHHIKKEGMLAGKDLSLIFSMLRSNDLIWSYVVNNYLMGRQPVPFDILYWNSDPTNLPADMYVTYINKMYLENQLIQPEALTFCGEKIDLSKVDVPMYFLSTVEDHIAPWISTFSAKKIFPGDLTFVLGASGHVAGVINPATKNKRHYWLEGKDTTDANEWLEAAEKHQGSWWPNWSEWLKGQGGEQVAAPEALGNEEFSAIEPAPGRYVAKRVE